MTLQKVEEMTVEMLFEELSWVQMSGSLESCARNHLLFQRLKHLAEGQAQQLHMTQMHLRDLRGVKSEFEQQVEVWRAKEMGLLQRIENQRETIQLLNEQHESSKITENELRRQIADLSNVVSELSEDGAHLARIVEKAAERSVMFRKERADVGEDGEVEYLCAHTSELQDVFESAANEASLFLAKHDDPLNC